LNALVSQARALTAQAGVTFHPELQPAAFHIALWLNTFVHRSLRWARCRPVTDR
jgi:hypothetical protein